jgi:hypothetical protein
VQQRYAITLSAPNTSGEEEEPSSRTMEITGKTYMVYPTATEGLKIGLATERLKA